MKNDTVWTAHQSMAEVFGKNILTISKHLSNILVSEELLKEQVTFNSKDSSNNAIFIINPNAKTQPILYDLDVIISAAYQLKTSNTLPLMGNKNIWGFW